VPKPGLHRGLRLTNTSDDRWPESVESVRWAHGIDPRCPKLAEFLRGTHRIDVFVVPLVSYVRQAQAAVSHGRREVDWLALHGILH